MLNSSDEDIQAKAEEQSRLARELAEAILADSEFRASSFPPPVAAGRNCSSPRAQTATSARRRLRRLELAEDLSGQAYRLFAAPVESGAGLRKDPRLSMR